MSEARLIGPVGSKAKRRVTAGALESVPATLRDWAELEAGRFILWAPVLMICGVVAYFALPVEPPVVMFGVPLVIASLVWGVGSARALARVSLFARFAMFIALGGLLATLRTAGVEAPVLPRAVGPVGVEAVLLKVENRAGDQRLTLAPERIGALTPDQTPVKIRVTWRGEPTEARPGDRVRIFGQLMPPPGPAMPGGFDYGRQLYFEQIGAVGFLYAQPEVREAAAPRPFRTRLETWRSEIAGRVLRLTPGQGAPVAAALVTGKRDAIPPEVTDNLRDTGLAHLLAISGLHMGLVCGLLFFSLRWILACHPGWAASMPIKKWAAVGAILGGIVYLLISGAPVSAQRAFIMALIGFLAIIADRRAISLRNVALAAVAIIFLSPEAVMGAGFQMSFAAVMALVATYDAVRTRWPGGASGKVAGFLGALFLTSFIAGLATSPMAIFHFNRIASYGLGANLVVMPLFTLIVMPTAVLGLILMPTGLDALVWPVTGWALGLILYITEWVAGLGGAVLPVPQWSGLAFGLVMAGMLVLCLCRAPWRLVGLGLILLGSALGPLSPRPVLMISEDLKNVGAIDANGALFIENRRSARFTLDQWREHHGVTDERRDIPKFACGEEVCPVPTAGLVVLYTEDRASVGQACREADIVIAPLWQTASLEASCAARLITSETIARSGPVSVYGRGGGVTIREGIALRGKRPWAEAAQ